MTSLYANLETRRPYILSILRIIVALLLAAAMDAEAARLAAETVAKGALEEGLVGAARRRRHERHSMTILQLIISPALGAGPRRVIYRLRTRTRRRIPTERDTGRCSG